MWISVAVPAAVFLITIGLARLEAATLSPTERALDPVDATSELPVQTVGAENGFEKPACGAQTSAIPQVLTVLTNLGGPPRASQTHSMGAKELVPHFLPLFLPPPIHPESRP
jgi:hypothetical protein